MKNLTSPALIILKGMLFLVLGVIAAGLAIREHPTLHLTLLVILAIWGFCRFYYFAFYVLERYVDPGYRHSGLLSLARYLWQHRRSGPS